MDAYDLSHRLMHLWRESTPKNSGEMKKEFKAIPVCVWTDKGYREVTNISFNEKLNFIELEVDGE
jgi:hypothetical protein